ncbi:hypothetical protein BU17DRAFT_74293 [Hysterangium stoloniferum]|nr:hypothetical protein BU17DRAFT_74293 [Hysterangium stoloniferum]
MFFLHLLDNLPHLRLSDDRLQAIIWDWANPYITEVISESWQAGKYVNEVKPEQLTPMWADWKGSLSKHFYVNKIAQLRDGQFVIPLCWVIFKRDGVFIIQDPQMEHIPASRMKYNFLDLERQFGVLKFLITMPHLVQKRANGWPAYCIPIMLWADDVSGNRSKQYNAHMNMYVANVNLPHPKLAQEYFVWFCSTSPHASSSEQFEALSEDLGAYDCQIQSEIVFQIHGHLLPADNPQQAESNSNTGANANRWCHGDNTGRTAEKCESDDGYHALFGSSTPRQPQDTISIIKEQIWTAGLGVQDAIDKIQTSTGVKDKTVLFWIQKIIEKANLMQRDQLYTSATRDQQLNDHQYKGLEREAIKVEIKKVIQQQLFEWVLTQPPKRYKQLSAESLVTCKCLRPGDHYNILLDVPGLNPHQDSLCEILHTVLLGVDKYFWHGTNKVWDKKQDTTFAIHLQSSSIDGLTLSPVPAQYLVQYKNSLIQKHFKALQQLGVFHLHDGLCNNAYFELWKVNGELRAMLWYPEIKEIDTYLLFLNDLQILLDNVLDLWGVVDPMRILTKYKLHVLGAHMKEDIQCFGPAILFSTEVFEAPSFDIATTLADMEPFKHQVSGGYIQAGDKVRNFLKNNKALQCRLGWADFSTLAAGYIKSHSIKKENPSAWANVLGQLSSIHLPHDAMVKSWVQCKFIVSRSHDICKPGSWDFFESKLQGVTILAAKEDASAKKDSTIVIIEQFNIAAGAGHLLNMPILTQTAIVKEILPMAVLFIFNAQHDCDNLKCSVTDIPVKQGRDMTSRTHTAVIHANHSWWILNMHALHNAHLIRETLPSDLWKLKYYFHNRLAEHKKFAAQAREIGQPKWLESRAKAKATHAKNQKSKKGKQADLPTIPEEVPEEGLLTKSPGLETL